MANTALDLLVERLFDYSGMFPPASKSLSDTLKDAAGFSSTLTRPEMVNADIVLSISHLKDMRGDVLTPAGFDESKTCHISLLGSELVVSDADLVNEIEMLKKFNEVGEGVQSCKVSSYEIKVGEFLVATEEVLERHLVSLAESQTVLAIEPDLSGEMWQNILDRAVIFVAKHRGNVSLKFRGTGPTGIGNDKIAFVIAQACDEKINLKATGGLHHPFLEERYGNNLGFLGMSSSIYLRRALGEEFSIDDIMRCLCASDPSEMEFETMLAWRDKRIDLPTLRDLKKRYSFCIGSCSLQEPDEDLIRLFG